MRKKTHKTRIEEKEEDPHRERKREEKARIDKRIKARNIRIRNQEEIRNPEADRDQNREFHQNPKRMERRKISEMILLKI